MKTPERLAENYAAATAPVIERAFLAGYKAAQEHAHAALEEAEARMQELRDQLMEESGGRLRLFKDDADAKAAYQECLEEIDLDKAWQEGYKAAQEQDSCEHILDMEKMVDVNGWISVKDRLPEEYKTEVIVCTEYGDVRIAVKIMDGWISNDCEFERTNSWVTHWMPLPEPPKEES